MNKNMGKYRSEQEAFWAGKFGDDYIKRNKNKKLITANIALFSKIISCTQGIRSIIEFGANIGLNIIALKNLLPKASFSAIEINKKAVLELKKIKGLKVYHQSILNFKSDYKRDLVLTKGLLIHIDPQVLDLVYKLVYETSAKYICLVEYHNPTPIEVLYRGHKGKLFKRDFAGEMLDRFSDLRLVNYGFTYHRDNNFDYDDENWFLLEKYK